ncbi:TPA: quorum-sensing peptide PapR [Bacillus pseudomycoides]|nr:quorum-sensing peptide PapR [Bacillus pseudomycoides]
MQKFIVGNLVALAMLTGVPFQSNEAETNPKEETEEVDLMSILPFEY